jgi:hypothetical protein
VAADPELARSPERRLDWFYRRHPGWDERVELLPVYRVAVDPRAPAPAGAAEASPAAKKPP